MALTLDSGLQSMPDRIVLYGTSAIGKSTLAAWLPGPLFIDVDKGSRKLNVTRELVGSWTEIRGKLAAIEANPPKGVRSIVVDTATTAEEYAKEFVIETRRTQKGATVDSIEGFGWGSGWKFVYDEFTGLLADLDRLNAKGFIVCIICHVVASPVPNPAGEDWLRWEPLLYRGDKQGNGNIRTLLQNWADQTLFLTYDVFVKDGKGEGGGSRSIYTAELPTHIAKSRNRALVAFPYTLEDPGAVWRELGIV